MALDGGFMLGLFTVKAEPAANHRLTLDSTVEISSTCKNDSSELSQFSSKRLTSIFFLVTDRGKMMPFLTEIAFLIVR